MGTAVRNPRADKPEEGIRYQRRPEGARCCPVEQEPTSCCAQHQSPHWPRALLPGAPGLVSLHIYWLTYHLPTAYYLPENRKQKSPRKLDPEKGDNAWFEVPRLGVGRAGGWVEGQTFPKRAHPQSRVRLASQQLLLFGAWVSVPWAAGVQT